MAARRVQALLMGGQACVLYGAAEFSRDTDLFILADSANLDRLRSGLRDLQAECIAVPPFEVEYLHRGHAIHFRCFHPEAREMRLDVMSILPGLDPFAELWSRRTTIGEGMETPYELLALPDLVRAKKTQRDKDWLMVRRLLEANYYQHQTAPDEWHLRFWFKELRTPELLFQLATKHPKLCQELTSERSLLLSVRLGDAAKVTSALAEEEFEEKRRDKSYWKPLRAELERLRHQKLKK
jgi:hypothetical protein